MAILYIKENFNLKLMNFPVQGLYFSSYKKIHGFPWLFPSFPWLIIHNSVKYIQWNFCLSWRNTIKIDSFLLWLCFPRLSITLHKIQWLSRPGKLKNKIPWLFRFSRTRTNSTVETTDNSVNLVYVTATDNSTGITSSKYFLSISQCLVRLSGEKWCLTI